MVVTAGATINVTKLESSCYLRLRVVEVAIYTCSGVTVLDIIC